MEDYFKTVWDTLDCLNTVPKNIIDAATDEIDVLYGASPSFISIFVELELCTDFKKRAALAKKYIDENEGIKEIDYPELGGYLSNYTSASLDTWRKLYLLERSIEPRTGDRYTWVERLKIFYNTFVREAAVNNTAIYKGKKLYWIKGNKENPTNHDKLVYGSGKWGPDFYFYDDNLPGDKAWQKMVKVEMKHGDNNIDVEVNKYKNHKFLYGAKYLLLAMSDGSYYMVDYNQPEATYEELNITCQDVFKI